MQTFGGRIHRRRQARRPRTIDRHVVFLKPRLRHPTEVLRKFAYRRRVETHAVRELHNRQPLCFVFRNRQSAIDTFMVAELDPVERDDAPLQEIPQRKRFSALSLADEADIYRRLCGCIRHNLFPIRSSSPSDHRAPHHIGRDCRRIPTAIFRPLPSRRRRSIAPGQDSCRAPARRTRLLPLRLQYEA
jgi:hypothetical protein